MARARNIKPSFFTNEELVELPFETRLLFIGLWTLADRDGRLEDRPKRIKMAVFPADNVDVERCLCDLQASGFIDRYEAEGTRCIQIVNFLKHQNPHIKEAPSALPERGKTKQAPEEHGASTVQAQFSNGASPADSLIPDSLIPDSLQREQSKAESVLVEPTPESLAPQVTDAGSACLQMRAAGIQGVNPSHPKLLALLAAGITPNEIGEVAREERAKGKGMAWVLAVAEGRRREAANVTALPAAIPSGGARASPAEQRRQKQDAWLDELLPNHRRKPQPAKDLNDERTLDAEAPRRLG